MLVNMCNDGMSVESRCYINKRDDGTSDKSRSDNGGNDNHTSII